MAIFPLPTTWGDGLSKGVEVLHNAGIPTPRLDASVLLSHLLAVPRAILMAYPERPLSHDIAGIYSNWIERRSRGEPVAYLIGHKEFMGLDFVVDRRVLVPRPETELVVEAAINALQARLGPLPVDDDQGPVPDILAADIGTGSGAIAIALAVLEPRIGRVYAVDVSADALAVARHNADRLSVCDRISLLQGDLLEPVPVPVDVIVANLPYIDPDSGDAMPNVVAFEPHEALFSFDHGLGHILNFLSQAVAHVRPHGIIVVEFGYDQREAIAQHIAAFLPNAVATFGKDYAGWDRYVVIQSDPVDNGR